MAFDGTEESCPNYNNDTGELDMSYNTFTEDENVTGDSQYSNENFNKIYFRISLSLSIPNALNIINNGICLFIIGNLTVIRSLLLLIFTTVVLAYLNVFSGIDLICAEKE